MKMDDPSSPLIKGLDIARYSEKIINTMAEALVFIGSDGTILMVNQSFERMLGYKKEEIVGKSCAELNCDLCDLHGKGMSPKYCQLFSYGKDVKKRCHVKKKDGTYLAVLKNASILRNDDNEDMGAVEILTDISELDRLDREVDSLSRQLLEDGSFHGIIGKSQVIMKVFELVEKAAWSESPIIIFGESGTGKELIAQAVHQLGKRKHKPFIQLNCAALNESLLESELFGHVKGAFTGAFRHRVGRFETASGGDIFLDEIGDVPISIQVKLLRVLEQKQIERVGDQQPIPVDVRLITATNKNLEEMIARQDFREDFFFRINVIPIYVPALRDRLDDIPLMVDHFIRNLCKRTGKKITGLTSKSLNTLLSYSWPGNVRELKSVLEYAFVVAEEGLISPDQLPRSVLKKEKSTNGVSLVPVPEMPAQNSEIVIKPQPKAENHAGAFIAPVFNENDPKEKIALVKALNDSRGNQSEAARLLGVSRVTVWNRMKKYNIDLKRILVS
jgi:two-component system, NtrC family, response regulator HydG